MTSQKPGEGAGRSAGRHILLAVTGSIAAYKAPSVLRGLMDRGHTVRVLMSASAQKLICPATFRALSGQPVVTSLFIPEEQASLVHVELSEWADALAIVPATANIIGKITCGIADEVVSCTWMACDCPKLIAPAMNDVMWLSPAVQRNVTELRKLPGVHLIEPVAGRLASGKLARVGCLAPVDLIVQKIDDVARAARAER